MKEKKTLKFVELFNRLETVEQKSFWMVAPFSAVIGLASFFIIGTYDFFWTTIVLAVTCLLIPAILMIGVSKRKNYHSAYLVLCLLLGAVSAPLCLFFTGGFLGGNMLFCSLVTGLTALCYMPKHRWIAFGSCFLANVLSFFLVLNLGSPLPLTEVKTFIETLTLNGNQELISEYNKAVQAIGFDQLFTYTLSSFGLFLVLFWVTSDIKQFKINQDALTRYFDTEKRKEIFKMVEDKGKVLSEHKKAAILFADISNFTSLTEKMNPDLVSEFLNDFFTAAGKHIHATGGIIDKFIGDCIMAFWSGDDKDCVSNCAKSMLDLRQEILDKSEDIYKKYGVELNFSAGIAYGDVIFGDIGSETMHDFTIIGDAVNIASRIQGYATSGEMLVSDLAAFQIKDTIVLEKMESNHFFKGKNKPTDIYRIIRFANAREESDEVNAISDFEYELYICGCRGSFPVSGLRFSEYGGETSCYVIKKDNYACIVDCGTGLKNSVELVKDCKKVDILLTHVHYDHILGLLMSKFPESIDVKIYGRFDKWNKSSSGLVGFMEKPYWPIEMSFADKITVNIKEEIRLTDDIVATFYKSDHPDDACVIKLMCGGKKVVFLADCEDATKIEKSVSKDSDILFFDGMFDDKDTVSHKGWGHGTWQDGIRFLDGRNIKKLVITHHNPECGDHTLMMKETEARSMAQNVSFAKSGDIFHF